MALLIFSALPLPRRPIVFTEPGSTVIECVNIMANHNIGAVVLRDNYNIVSERDIIRSCVQRGLNPNTTTAAEIAYAAVNILNLYDTVEKAMEVITKTKRRHILIEEGGEIVSVLSIGDLLFHILDDKTRVIEHLEKYIRIS